MSSSQSFSSLSPLETIYSLIPTSLQPFIFLSYPTSPTSSWSSTSTLNQTTTPSYIEIDPGSTKATEILFKKGPKDALFVLFWAVAFTLLREFTMRYVFAPFARRWVREAGGGGGGVVESGKSPSPTTTTSATTTTIEPEKEKLKVNKLKETALEKERRMIANGGDYMTGVVQELNGVNPLTMGGDGDSNSKNHDGSGSSNGLPRQRRDSKIKRLEEQQALLKKSQLKVTTRFSEQAWSFCYFVVSWTSGLYILTSSTSAPFSSQYLWGSYPYSPLSYNFKFFYLAQLGFWFHQALTLHLEARRKDHFQMALHHVITIAIMTLSYVLNFTRVGVLVLVLMDFCDILLPLAKMLRYLSFATLTDITFVLFLVSWFITRQVAFLIVLLSVFFELPKHVPYEWNPAEGRYLSFNAWVTFVAMLSAIQIMNCIWFYMVCRVAYRVIAGLGAEDVRSEDDSEADAEDREAFIAEAEQEEEIFDGPDSDDNVITDGNGIKMQCEVVDASSGKIRKRR